jgi:predicted MFS family arabinose efflux permease
MSKNIHHFMKTLIAINVFIIVSANFLVPLWGDFVRYIGGDIRVAGNAICIFSIVIGVVTCFAAKLESILKKDEWFLVASSVWMTLSFIGYFFVHHPWQLYIVQISLGLAGSFQCPAIYSLYHRYLPKDQSAFHWGIWNGFYNIAYGAGSLLGAYILQGFSFKAVFSVMFIVSLTGLILTILTAKKMRCPADRLIPRHG